MRDDLGIRSFNALSDKNCTILILGTMPGNESLSKNQYYGHPDNTFWDIIIRVLKSNSTELEIENFTYNQKQDLLLKNKIALWDVLQYCTRAGSLDSKIRNEIKNDFEQFFKIHNKIRTVLFNGLKAEKYFMKYFQHLIQSSKINTLVLPSTSPSHTLNTFIKLKKWREALLESM